MIHKNKSYSSSIYQETIVFCQIAGKDRWKNMFRVFCELLVRYAWIEIWLYFCRVCYKVAPDLVRNCTLMIRYKTIVFLYDNEHKSGMSRFILEMSNKIIRLQSFLWRSWHLFLHSTFEFSRLDHSTLYVYAALITLSFVTEAIASLFESVVEWVSDRNWNYW